MNAKMLVSSLGIVMIALGTGPVITAQGPVLSRQALDAKAQELDSLTFLQGVFRVGPGVPAPKATATVYPKYTAEAMRQKIQGEVAVEAVVDSDGNVIRVRVKQSLDAVYGLDENAIVAAKQFKFDPATIDPKASPVLVEFRLEFRLH
jgi:TonB family protein